MIFGDLKLNRSLQKDPNQSELTKDAVFTASNPKPKTGNNSGDQLSRGNEKDDGSKNILTGTVITSCFIQTSALPSRIEMSGNDLTFYDNTFEENGVVKGDTSRLIFTHDLNSNEGFILEKRSSTLDTFDNVLSLYANPPKTGKHNYLFIGRDGRDNSGDLGTRNLGYLELTANGYSDGGVNQANGQILMEATVDQESVVSNLLIVNVGSIVSGKKGIAAQLSGSGDGTSNDEGFAALAYIDKNTLSVLYYINVSKTGIQMIGLPTSASGLPSGSIWRSGSDLKIVP